MKKIFITLASLAILSLSVNAQWQPTTFPGSSCFAINGDTIYAEAEYGVFFSSNNGNSWFSVNTGLPAYPMVNVLANKGDTIFAGTQNRGIYISSNGSASWTQVNTGLTDSNVTAIAISKNNIFAGTKGGGVFMSSNNGQLWTPENTGLTNTHVSALAIKGDSIFAGTFGGNVFLSMNNGGLWSATGLTDTVQTFAISGNKIFAGTLSKGIYMSSNGGSSWAAVNTGLTCSNVNAMVVNGNDIYAGTGCSYLYGGGVFMSSNNGQLWTAINTGIIYNSLFVYALAIEKDTLFAGTDSIVWKRRLSDITGIIEIDNNKSNIVVYPNPAKDKLTIESLQKSTIEILNIQGQTISQQQIQQGKTDIDISGLAKGVYILRLCSNDKTAVTRIVKE